MTEYIAFLWQLNLEISLLLVVILGARLLLRKTANVFNAYLLWLSLPVALIASHLVSYLDFDPVPLEPIAALVGTPVLQNITQATPSDTVVPALGLLWALISLVLVIRLVMQHRFLRNTLSDIEVGTDTRYSKYPVVIVDKADFSPAAYGFFTPTIYLPEQLRQTLSTEQLKLIIAHEEQHITQQHLWLNLAWDSLVCLFWFNPLAYLSRRSFRQDQELFCDYLVLRRAHKAQHKAYGHALLSTASTAPSTSLVSAWNTFSQLEERIMHINTVGKPGSGLLLFLFTLAIVAGSSIYSFATAHETSHAAGAAAPAHTTSAHTFVVKHDGVTYIEENGEKYIVEDGKRRRMSEEERTNYQRLLTKPELRPALPKAPLAPQQPHIVIVKPPEVDVLSDFEFHALPEGAIIMPQLDQQELDRISNSIVKQFKVVTPSEPTAELELDMVLAKIEALRASGGIRQAQAKQASKQLRAAKQKIERDRERLSASEKKARDEMVKLLEKFSPAEPH